jgi:L-ascorbate metabolism protein UlaG (beta-lactamase superfamily)
LIHIQFFGYNAFKIEKGSTRLIIDPGRNLKWNKLNSLIPKQEWDTDYIFVTHEHDDHADFAIKVAKETGADIICHKNLQQKYSKKLSKNRVFGLDPDKKTTINGFTIRTFSVLHGKATIRIFKKNLTISPKESSSLGFIIILPDISIMNLGDTILLPEWKDNPPFTQPDILMVPAGGQMTMDPEKASEFVLAVQPKVVIPCHYQWHILFYRRKTDISPLKQACEENNILFKEIVRGEKWSYQP